jgi:hypothetical protein
MAELRAETDERGNENENENENGKDTPLEA